MKRGTSRANFLIAGERRSGTTTLYHWLNSHPDVFLPANVDSFFFLAEELKGTVYRPGPVPDGAWERSHAMEDFHRRFETARGECAVGEKCADLLFWRPSHPRVAGHLPGVRLIVTLRDPVRRAWSHYWNEVGKGRETLEFPAAIEEEHRRSAESDWAHLHLSYTARGDYAASLRALFQHVPRERVLVLFVERITADPTAAREAIAGFLAVDPRGFEAKALAPRNTNWTTVPRPWVRRLRLERVDAAWSKLVKRATDPILRGRPHRWDRERALLRRASWPFRTAARGKRMDPVTESRLRDRFRPRIAELEQLLDELIPEWRVT